MKKIILRSIVPLLTVVALSVASAAAAPQQSAPIQGVWDAQVTTTDCNGNILMEFRAFLAIHQGGTLTTTGNANSPALSSPGLGTWQRTGMRTFNATFQFFTFNPDGSFAGTVKIDPQIHLSADGNSYTDTETFAVYDPDGNLVFSGCGTAVATRLP